MGVLNVLHLLQANIANSIRMNYRYARRHLKIIALFGVIGEPFFYFAWSQGALAILLLIAVLLISSPIGRKLITERDCESRDEKQNSNG